MPSAGLAAATALLGAFAAFVPAAAGSTLGTAATAQQDAVRSQEWWLAGLHVRQAAASGVGVTVAVLGTGVAAGHPDLAGAVITGPDYTGSGRAPGSPYWGVEGTAVAGIIAGHGHGARGAAGIVGVAPAAKILAVRVTLEYNDPLASDPDLAGRLPDAIAAGIRYAVDHGARIIDLPLDPGTLGLTGQPDLAAVGGSHAEQAAVGYALRNNVLLVAPAGDDGMGAGIVNYPAAYRGVIAVGAVAQDGRLASFTSRRSYVALTAPGVGLVAAAPPAGYVQLSTTCLSSAIVAGVAALVLSRFPHLTVAEMTRALTASTAAATGGAGAVPGARATTAPIPARPTAGSGYGTVDAARAVQAAAMIVAAAAPRRPAGPAARPRKPARPSVAPPRSAADSSLAGSVLRDAVAAAAALILLLVIGLVAMRVRHGRGTAARDAGPRGRRARARGSHEHGRAGRARARGQPGGPGGKLAEPGAGARPAADTPAAGGWPFAGSGQGSSLAGLADSAAVPPRPAIMPMPSPRAGRGAGTRGTGSAGPPWEPAPEPERATGPLGAGWSPLPVSRGAPGSAPGIRVPGDMASLPVAMPERAPGASDSTAADFTAAHPADFAAAPRAPDFSAPPPSVSSAADLAATEAFRAAADPGDSAEPP